MFYSHQLLARKAPLGQIWMAATMHSKLNRRNLDKINLIRICEEILNPSVPMALRLSGILMGGVVIVYERKVKLLYDDVNRLLVEINATWKVKPAVDRTLLPKRRNQAKYEDVTLPENQDTDLGDVEQSIDYSGKQTATGVHQSAFIAMRLDTIDEFTEMMEGLRQKDPNELHHQADIANITLDDHYDSHRADTGPYDRFERFDISGEEETLFNIPSQEHTRIPSPPQMQPELEDLIFAQPEEKPEEQYSAEAGEAKQPERKIQKRVPPRKRAKKGVSLIIDDEQTMIPNIVYQSWIQDSSDLTFTRPKIQKVNPRSTMKFTKLLEVPPVALSCGSLGRDHKLYYPEPLLTLWIRSIQPPHDSPSGGRASPLGPQPSSSSPPHRQDSHDPPPELFMAGFGAGGRVSSTERQRSNQPIGAEFAIDELLNGARPAGSTDPKAQTGSTPGGAHSWSFGIPSPDDYVLTSSGNNSGRLNRKRPNSSSRRNADGLELLDENIQMIDEAAEHDFPVIDEQLQPGLKIPRYSQHIPTPAEQLVVETAHTQTQRPFVDEETEAMTRNMTANLKAYFEGSGAPQEESLSDLAYGLNRKKAAQLFYQTCVLATRGVLKVEQNEPYGDIMISRGPMM